MKQALAVLAILTMVAFAGQVRVDLPGSGGTDDDLTYFNGSPHWLTWGGMYRGTWFNTDDFMPGSTGCDLDQLEYWFFQHASYPWDTDQFYSELWNGDQTGPQILLAQQVVTASHYSPSYHYYVYIITEQYFWCLVNTELSAGGWPSILGDSSMPGDAGHSFYSDDFQLWESWGELGEYSIACWLHGLLNTTTWGSLKALF